MRALWSAASGMLAQQLNVDTIANNLANVDTTGFKKQRADFQDLLYQTIQSAGTPTTAGSQLPVGIQVGLGVRPISIQKIFTQGEFRLTENPLDLVIEGDGFFQVILPNGEIAYTRDGTFKKDATGKIVNSDGYPLEPEIVIPSEATRIVIAEDGTVSCEIPGQSELQQIGQITLAKFLNPAGLDSIGKNLFKQTPASGDVVTGTPGLEGFGKIAQGILEMSNVKVVEEMIHLIIAQRAYEVNSRAIRTSDDMLAEANNLRR